MPDDPQKAHGRVEILDLLRAFAILAVMAFHYCFRGAAPDQGFTALSLPALASYAKYGGFGVQLFFIISGFVIAYSAESRSTVEFGIARFARIYPGFIVCMSLTFLATLAFGAPRFQSSITQWLANYVIAAPALHRPFMDGAYWSLVDEVTFYVWITALLMIGSIRRHIDIVITIWLGIALLNAGLRLTVVERVFLTDQSGFFAAGLVLYEMYCGRRDLAIRLLLGLSAVTAISQSLDVAQWDRSHFGAAYSDWVVAGLSLAAIAAVGLAIRVRRVPIPANIIVAIGGITYPLYLLHQHVGYMVFNRLQGSMAPALIVAVTVVAMIAVAWGVWRFIERPGQRLLKYLLTRAASYLNDTVAMLQLKVRGRFQQSISP